VLGVKRTQIINEELLGVYFAERAVSSECSRTFNSRGDCRSNSDRIRLAYSFHGLYSRPTEWMTNTSLCSVACTLGEERSQIPAQMVITHFTHC
jgi:hypothetical protein